MGNKNKDKKKGKKEAKKQESSKHKKQIDTSKLVSVGKAPTFTKQANVVDFLDETPMSQSELFGCVTFASPGQSMIEDFKIQIANELALPDEIVSKIVDSYIKKEHPLRAFKYVGGRSSIDQCRERVSEVENDEPEFHIYVTENGKWLTFDPSPELIQDENYREQQLNEIIKSKKIGEQRSKEFFRSEMRKKVEKARLEGTKEGQQILLEAEEPFEAVKFRADSTAKNIEEYREKIIEMERTRVLAEQKLEKMRSEGKDKETDGDKKVDEKLAALGKTFKYDENADIETKKKLTQLNEIEIERSKNYPDNLGKATVEHLQKQSQAPNNDERKIFDEAPMIPSRDYPQGEN